MKSTLNTIVFACFLFVFTPPSLAQSGTLDQSFGKNGQVHTSNPNGSVYGRATVIQTDGKIVVAGNADSLGIADFILVRYKNDGSTDTLFGDKGKVKTDFRKGYDIGYAVALQADGKILVAGKTGTKNTSDADFALARYNSDGSIDTSFGLDGKVITDFKNTNDIAYSVRLQSDGKIIVGGTSQGKDVSNLFQGNFALVRYNTDGTIDSSFGTLGKVVTDVGSRDNEGKSITIQNDGKILFGGVKYFNVSDGDFALVRYTTNGTPDSTFGSNGIVITNIDTTAAYNESDWGNSIVTQKDGKIIMGGYTHAGEMSPKIGLTRYNKDGTLDNSFGTNGKVDIDLPNINLFGGSSPIPVIALSKDEKIIALAAGSTKQGNGAFPSLIVARYNTNGSLDNTFGENGAAIVGEDGAASFPFGLAMQEDNKIIATGAFLEPLPVYDTKIITMRFNNEIVLPISFSSFSATKKQSSVLLNWQTASEQNNSYFSIERSNNGNTNFKEIGRVNSKGNSNQIQQYTFEDFSPLSGGNYYRLNQVDKDGKSTYSKTVFVDFDKPTSIKLYPNPVKDVLTVEGLNANTKTTISIIDLQGNVLAKMATTNSTYSWNIKQLPAGNYYLRIEADKKVTTMKFVKE